MPDMPFTTTEMKRLRIPFYMDSSTPLDLAIARKFAVVCPDYNQRNDHFINWFDQERSIYQWYCFISSRYYHRWNVARCVFGYQRRTQNIHWFADRWKRCISAAVLELVSSPYVSLLPNNSSFRASITLFERELLHMPITDYFDFVRTSPYKLRFNVNFSYHTQVRSRDMIIEWFKFQFPTNYGDVIRNVFEILMSQMT